MLLSWLVTRQTRLEAIASSVHFISVNSIVGLSAATPVGPRADTYQTTQVSFVLPLCSDCTF